MRFVHRLIILFLLLSFATSSSGAEGEYQVKAAMLYNFAKFVEWPADSFNSENKITFCIAGKSPIFAALQKIQGKQVKGRTIAVRQISHPEDVADCQILFIPQSENGRLGAYLHQTDLHSTLTISDQERFAGAGGMIGFYEEDNKVRFEINLENALKRRLQISSHLLNLARRVR